MDNNNIFNNNNSSNNNNNGSSNNNSSSNSNSNSNNNNIENSTIIKIYPEIKDDGQLKFQLPNKEHRIHKNCLVFLANDNFIQLKRSNTSTEESKFKFFVNWFDTEKESKKSIMYNIVIKIGNEDPQCFGPITLWYNHKDQQLPTSNKPLGKLTLTFREFSVSLLTHKEHKIFKSANNDNAHKITIKLSKEKKKQLLRKRVRENRSNIIQGVKAEIGTASTDNIVSQLDLLISGENSDGSKSFYDIKANHGEFGILKARQLLVTSDPNFKKIISKCPNDILKSVTEELELYIYEWLNKDGYLTGDMDAGPMADQLWELSQKIGIPLVTFHDGSRINSEEEMKNRKQNGKHLIVCNNALNTLNLQCIKELKEQQDIFQEFTGEQKKYVEQFSVECKSINETIKTLMNQVEKNVNDIENLTVRLEILENSKIKKHRIANMSYNGKEGIIFLAVNFTESIAEAKKIKNITDAEIFIGTVDDFKNKIQTNVYRFVHFIGHGKLDGGDVPLGLTFIDTTSNPMALERIDYKLFINMLLKSGITLFTMSACETAIENSNVVQYFIDGGGLYSYGFKKKVSSIAAPILSVNFYYQLFVNQKTPKDAFEFSTISVSLKVKKWQIWKAKNLMIYDTIFDLTKENQGGDPIFKENDEKIKELYKEHVQELCLLRASKDNTPFLKSFFKFIEKEENFSKVFAAVNKNDGKEIERVQQEMKLKNILVENISFKNVSSEMIIKLRKICEAKLLAQDDLTIEQEGKYQKYENAINAKRNIGCVHIKGFAGTGKTFLGLHFICKMLIENPNANILFACTQNGFAYFFARWILIRMLSRKRKHDDDETKGEENDNNNDAVQHDPDSILNRIHFCTRKTGDHPQKATLQSDDQRNVYLKFVPIDETINNYDLVVIDEAHHIVRKNDKVWKKILLHFADAELRVILSDDNQGPSAIRKISNAIKNALEIDEEIFPIVLRDVVRSTQAITLFSHLFRKKEEKPSCKNKEFGSPIEPFLIVDSNKDDNNNNDTITQYIMRTINALEHIKPVFAMKDKKDLGWFLLSRGRVVIILPDDNPSLTVDKFTMKLRAEIDKKALEINFDFFKAEKMFGMFPQLKHTSVQIVVDTISNQDGLEYDAAIVVGFDETIKDDDEESLLDKKKASVYRAITRAKLFVGIVDKPVQYGLYHSIWTDTVLEDKSQMEESNRSKLYEKESKLTTKIEKPTSNSNLTENPENHRMDLDTNDIMRQPKTKQRELNEERQSMAGTEVSIEVKKVKQAFINTNNIQESTISKLGQPKQSLFNSLEDINIELNDTNDQEDDNTNAVDIKKSAAYMKWEKEFDGKTEVDLSYKNLTDEDALAIGELLKTNKTLTELNLFNNNITDVQSIGEGLKTNNTLTWLYLENNNITDVQSIGEALKTNNTLEIVPRL